MTSAQWPDKHETNAVTVQDFDGVLALIIGLPCWSVQRGHGNMLSFEFGKPSLMIREPYQSRSTSERLQRSASHRVVKPIGEYTLWVHGGWQAKIGHGKFADSDAAIDEVVAAAREIDGQRLLAVTVDAASNATSFVFDLGATLNVLSDGSDSAVWALSCPDGSTHEFTGVRVWRVREA